MLLDRTTPPKFKKAKTIRLPEAQTVRLNQKTTCHYIAIGQQPIVQIALVVNAGKWFESRNGAATFMAKMLLEGTTSFNAHQITSQFDQYGAVIECSASDDHITLTVHVLSKYLDKLIPVLQEIIYAPTFPESELIVLKQIQKQTLKINNQKNNIYASKKFRELLFGVKHPYGTFLTEKAIDEITTADLHTHYNNVFKNNRATLFLSGDVTEKTLALLEDWIDLGQNDTAVTHEFSPFQNEKRVLGIKRAGALQSSIRIGKIIINKLHDDYFRLLLTNEVLGGYFGSRLMKNIREDKGYTYGIYSSMVHLLSHSYLVIGTDVKADSEKNTIDEIFKELSKLKSESIGEDELTTVKNYLIGKFQSQINTPFSLMNKYKALFLHNLSPDYYSRYLSAITEVSTDDVMAMAKKYFDDASLATLTVGK